MARAASRQTSWSTGFSGRGPSEVSRWPPGTTTAQRVTVLGHTYLGAIGQRRRPELRQLIQPALVRAIDGGGGEGGDHVPPPCRAIGRQ